MTVWVLESTSGYVVGVYENGHLGNAIADALARNPHEGGEVAIRTRDDGVITMEGPDFGMRIESYDVK